MTAEIVKEVMPAFRGLGKPLLKAAVKSSVILAEHGRARFAEFQETLAGVRAEVREEMASEPQAEQEPLQSQVRALNGHAPAIGDRQTRFQVEARD